MKNYNKPGQAIASIGIATNTVLVVGSVIAGHSAFAMLYFMSAIAFFIALSTFKKREENDKR